MAFKNKTEAIKYNNQYNKEKYDRVNLTMPKGKKEEIQVATKYTNESVNAFLNRLIDNELKRIDKDSGGIFHFSVSEHEL